MTQWKSFLRADPTAWLLEKDNPSVQVISLKNSEDIKNPAWKLDLKEGLPWSDLTREALSE
jgi:hypothetical protein